MAVMVDEIAKRVLASLATRKPEPAPALAHPPVPAAPALATAPAPIEAPQAAPPAPPASSELIAPIATRIEPVRRVSPLRRRTGSILGLDISRPEPKSSDTDRE
jgi:hypothetical protein